MTDVSETIAYRGYLVCWNRLWNLLWIEKGGHYICGASSVFDAKRIIDVYLESHE
ncbi:MAG TPA: hypothetical protein VKB34_06745 [Povalibacter sp.]|nr:hypothetical protein [Povalibacter sp.]